jgi:flagellar protein FliO/FliZ
MPHGARAWWLLAQQRLLAAPALLFAATTFAADPSQPGAVGGPGFFGLLQVVLALLLVLGAIVALAWLLRRIGPGRTTAGGLLKVVGGVMIGPKERLVVVEVGQTWLIVGVGAASVSLVHSMPRPEGADATPAQQAFSRLIGQALRSRSPGD